MNRSVLSIVIASTLSPTLLAPHGFAAPPLEVTNLRLPASGMVQWNAAAGAADYNIYRGRLGALASSSGFECLGDEVATTSFAVPDTPAPGSGFAYLVSGESADGEGTVGTARDGSPRSLIGRCNQVMAWHVLNRVAYGWNEWASDRLKTLGAVGFINEQLDPASISEASNTALNDALALTTPLDDFSELGYRHAIRSIHARRQLEEQLVVFLENHFNVDAAKVGNFYSDPRNLDSDPLPDLIKDFEELNTAYRQQAFSTTFRELLETSSKSRAMTVYLDTQLNVVGHPNENYARELLELHSLGVDGGYTEQDIRALARVFTGWKVCKKKPHEVNDPAKACLPTATFANFAWGLSLIASQHDAGAKTLFAGTPYQKNIPPRAGLTGISDAEDALDAIAAHPSTARFLSRKLAQKFLTDTPTEAMIQAGVNAYNATGGSFIEVVRAILGTSLFLDPKLVGGKIKWPDEFAYSAARGLRSETTATTFPLYIGILGELGQPYLFYDAPTGVPERGDDWLDSSQILGRQNYGLDVTMKNTEYLSHVTEMVSDYGLNTAEKIVDFFSDALLGGRVAPAERQRLITYLNTNDLGQPSAYEDARVREMVGTMLGLLQALEQ